MPAGPYVEKMLRNLPEGASFVMASTHVVVMNDDDKFLITKREDNGKWDFPGGACEETDGFAKTAAKELKEEINLDVIEENLELLGVISNPDITTVHYPNKSMTKYYVTVFGYVVDDFEPTFNDGEVVDYAFVTLEELLKYDLVPASKYIAEQLKENNIPFIN